jgi:membrane associated rhomboid family serine protease
MKELAFKFAAGVVLINGLGELAVSQIHILVSAKVFAAEIGIYLFLFIISGLVTSFNIFLLKKMQGMIFLIVSCWITAGSGYIYLRILQADVATQKALTMADANTSWLLVAISIFVCLVASFAIPLLGWDQLKRTEIS